ncbi:porin family protein [Hymenobacter aerophilus]|uniref:porin family protein n=1 Tax=Hymenobacter aerophilus TaxID=119644 RepID=UPI000365A15B|nr:porin family protein [Hymenobacter aerophilus]
MKKIAALTLMLASAASLAHAQSGPRYGIRFGGTYSTIGGKDADMVQGYSGELDYKLGYNAGISAQFPLSSDGFWTIAPELIYNRKGFERSFKVTNFGEAKNAALLPANVAPGDVDKFTYEDKRVLSYIDLPLPVRVNTAPGGSGLYFELGPQVGYMVASKRETTSTVKFKSASTSDIETKSPSNKAKEDLASFDIGGVAGLGYQTESGISIGLRYNQGLKTLFDTKNVSAKNEPKAFNRAFMVQVGYLLPTR